MNEKEGLLSAIPLPEHVKAVPDEVSRVLACNCLAEQPCQLVSQSAGIVYNVLQML